MISARFHILTSRRTMSAEPLNDGWHTAVSEVWDEERGMMPIKPKTTENTDPSFKPLMRSLALELCIYAPLVTIYFIIVLHFAKEPLIQLYEQGSTSYAFLTLILILLQGVLLEAFTSWLLRRIGLR